MSYIVEFYSAKVAPTSVRIFTNRPLSTACIRRKLGKLGFIDVSLVWVSGLK